MSGGGGDNRVHLIFRFRGQRKSIKQSVIDLYVVSSQSITLSYERHREYSCLT